MKREQCALSERIYEQVARLNGQPTVCLFFDLEHDDDNVFFLHTLIGLTLERHFPKRLLHTAMQAHFWERILRASEIVGKPCSLTTESWNVAR